MFHLNLIILSQIVLGPVSFFNVVSAAPVMPVDLVNPYIHEGLGEVKMSSCEIPITGTTAVDGSIPVTGGVIFDGEVRASGTVTIVARSGPSTRPRISMPGPLAFMLFTPRTSSNMPLPKIPIILRAISLPIKQDISAISIPALQPVSAAPHPIVPSLSFLPPVSSSLPNIVVPCTPLDDVTGCSQVIVSANDVPLTGTTVIDGVIPLAGDMAFNGYIPAKGSVVITCKSCKITTNEQTGSVILK